MRKRLVTAGLTAAFMAVTLPAMASVRPPVHNGPYTYTQSVHAPGRDLVTFHGDLCRGHTRYVTVLFATDSGGEEFEPGNAVNGHYSFLLRFKRGDGSRHGVRWYGTDLTATCADGSTAGYGPMSGSHTVIPVITVYQ